MLAPLASVAAPAGIVMVSPVGWSRVATKPSTYRRPWLCWYTTSTLQAGYKQGGNQNMRCCKILDQCLPKAQGWYREAPAPPVHACPGGYLARTRQQHITSPVSGRGTGPQNLSEAVCVTSGASPPTHLYTPDTRNKDSGLGCCSGRPKSTVHSGSALEVVGPGWSHVMVTCMPTAPNWDWQLVWLRG